MDPVARLDYLVDRNGEDRRGQIGWVVMRWELQVDLSERGAEQPIFARIAQAISGDIARGRLRAGERLPGTRSLAASLGVHRNTVVHAIDELVSQGWLTTEKARGTFVAGVPEAPRARVRSRAVATAAPREPGFPLGPAPSSSLVFPEPGAAALSLAGGRPDVTALPVVALGRAVRRALRAHSRELLDYGDPRGDPALRVALAGMLSSRRGLAVGPDDVLVTRGAQMALFLAARVLVRPGDVVAVEGLGYPPAWQAFRDAGAELRAVPVDARGIRVDALSRLAESGRLRAVYVTPHHQYPTLAVLSASRRLDLLELSRRHGFAIVEDDYDNEYHFEGRPVLPLASMDRSGTVIYVGSLSKVLAPGLRIGFVVAPRAVLERMTAERARVDRQGDLLLERAVAELMEDGEVQRHAFRMRRVYLERRRVLSSALRARLGDVLRFELPNGGLSLWVQVERPVDVSRWAERAALRGVLFEPGRRFSFDGRNVPAARLGFARASKGDIEEAVSRMALCLG